MARKSSQKKKVADHQASNHTKQTSDLGAADPDLKVHGDASEATVFPGEELRNGKTNEHKNNQKPRKQTKRDNKKEMNSVNGSEQPSSVDGESRECNGNSNTEVPSVAEENGSIPQFDRSRIRSRNHRQSKAAFFLNRLSNIQRVLQSIELPDNVLTRSLKASGLSALKKVSEWLEKQRPLLDAMREKFDAARGYVGAKIDRAYPVVMKWAMNVGSVVFLILMIWLDCAVRGIDSFLRMGTTSFFSVIWCSIFSMIAMAGIFKFLAVSAIATLIGVFIGFSLGILVLGFFGAVFLWIYGSFWTTMLVIFLGGVAYGLSHERVALLITTVYSVYCAWTYVGWLGLVVTFNLAFVSSDVLIYFLKNGVNQQRRSDSSAEQRPGMQNQQQGFFNTEHMNASSSSETSSGFSADRGPGIPSTSGVESELTSEDEIVRLLNCSDHYSVLGLTRFESVDVSLLKREYKKKAMLVHPDKNMGNEKAAEAFKKLQNAYEVLLDSAKQKAYDEDLRKEEILNIFRRFQSSSQKNGGHSFFGSGMGRSEADGEDALGESRRIACKKCNNFHVWVLTRKSKSQARWCQDCMEFHQAKDGDGWVEQSSQPFLFGLLQKVDSPVAFVCADSKIYDASEWYICQGMRCPANTHKPSFHVNTSLGSSSKYNNMPGTGKGAQRNRMPNVEDCTTEEELFEWFQNAVQAGIFDNINTGGGAGADTTAKTGGGGGGANKRKKKGKKQW